MPPVFVSLLPERFAPSTSLAGGAAPNVFRGANCRLEGADGPPRIVAYPGTKDLGQDYDLTGETVTGTVSTAADSPVVTGSGTAFRTELHVGQMLGITNGGGDSFDDVLVVARITSDTEFVADRAASATNSGSDAYYLWGGLFPLGGKRGVLRRGNGYRGERGDIIYVGDGPLFIDGTDSTFEASNRPKRLAHQTDGTYIENPIGFETVPAIPDMDPTATGGRGMLKGYYSFYFAWYNSVTKGFSNPSEIQKMQTTPPGTFYLSANQRPIVDFTIPYAIKTFLDAAVTTGTGNLNITGHGRETGDPVKLRNFSGALPVDAGTGSPLESVRTFYVIKVDADNLKLARTAALATAGTAVTFTSAAGGGTHVLYSIPANADGIRIYQSNSGGDVAAVNVNNAANGPWRFATNILLTDLDSSHQAAFAVLDEELGAIISGDNDPPPECEFVTEFASYPMALSAFGNTRTDTKTGSNPGNYVLMAKQSNFEGYPADWRVGVGGQINGFAAGLGRLFCLTENAVPFIAATGRTEIARLIPTGYDLPFTSRPFWTKGGISPHQICTIHGDVFVWSGGKLLMSPRNADAYANPFELTAAVEDVTEDWSDGLVFVKNDPYKQQLCIISSATRKNADGYWISEILPLDLVTNAWQPIIELSSPTRDMIVSAAEIIGNRLEMLVGGWNDTTGAYELATLRYNEANGKPIDYYFAITPSDAGEEMRTKKITAARVTGKFSDGALQFHGTRDGGSLSIADIEAGTNALLSVTLTDAASITRQFRKKFTLRRLDLLCVRFAGTWDGSGDPDRIDELVLEVSA